MSYSYKKRKEKHAFLCVLLVCRVASDVRENRLCCNRLHPRSIVYGSVFCFINAVPMKREYLLITFSWEDTGKCSRKYCIFTQSRTATFVWIDRQTRSEPERVTVTVEEEEESDCWRHFHSHDYLRRQGLMIVGMISWDSSMKSARGCFYENET